MFHLSRVLYRAAELYADRHAVSDGPAALTYRQLGERVGPVPGPVGRDTRRLPDDAHPRGQPACLLRVQVGPRGVFRCARGDQTAGDGLGQITRQGPQLRCGRGVQLVRGDGLGNVQPGCSPGRLRPGPGARAFCVCWRPGRARTGRGVPPRTGRSRPGLAGAPPLARNRRGGAARVPA